MFAPASNPSLHQPTVATPGLVLAPSIAIVGRSRPDWHALAEVLEAHDTQWNGVLEPEAEMDPDLPPSGHLIHVGLPSRMAALAEFAGRVCYWSFGARQSNKTTAQYIENILRQGHGSVLEHVTWTLYIEGVSRSLTHELVRHRVGVAVSQLSQRFVDDPSLLRLVVPPLALIDDAQRDRVLAGWGTQLVHVVEMYRDALERAHNAVEAHHPEVTPHTAKKMAAEAARAVLPNCVETRLVWTINARTARDFLMRRGGAGVEAEMRRFAALLAATLAADAPEFFPDLTFPAGDDGAPAVALAHGRV